MIELAISFIIACVIAGIALWLIRTFAPADLKYPLRLVVLALFAIWLIAIVLPALFGWVQGLS